MNKEEAISICNAIKKNIKCESTFDLNILKLNRNNELALETVLQTLGNSISKEVIEKKIEAYKKHLPDKTTYEEFRNGNMYSVIGKQTTYKLAIQVLQELLEGK